ncbi:MAG: NUDIX domain-containing protein, partial [Actinomycetota bacterium]
MNAPRTDTTIGSASLRIRPAARAVILTPDAHVVLVRFEFPAGSRWALPGGGLQPGEDHVTALARELVEEVGLSDVEIGPHLWTREHHIAFLDGRWDGQREHIHLVQVPEKFPIVPSLDADALRAEYLHEIRWWHIDEIGADRTSTFVPRDLHRHLQAVITDGPPSRPIDVEV